MAPKLPAAAAVEASTADDDASISRGSLCASASEDMDTTTGAGGGQTNASASDDRKEIQRSITQKETRAVLGLRVLVILVLMLASGAVSATVYMIARNGETTAFQDNWDASSLKVVQAFQDILHQMGAVSGLGVALNSFGVDHARSWPFVTITNFHLRAGNARASSKALSISYAPRLRGDQFHEWDEFVQSSDENFWIQEGLDFQAKLGVGGLEYAPNIAKTKLTYNRIVDPMHYFDTQEEGVLLEDATAEYYMPVWQISPVLRTGEINENQLRRTNLTVPQSEVKRIVITEKKAFIGGFYWAPPGTIRSPNLRTAYIATLLSFTAEQEVEYMGDPMASFYLPVFGGFNETDQEAVAIMTAIVHWKAYFQGILPKNMRGVDVVLKNSCEGFFTYTIDGEQARNVGVGDYHNPAFDKWVRVGEFKTDSLNDGTKRGLKLHKDGCQYSINVYPSQTFYDTFNTNTPLLITCSIGAVFIFTILMFLLYDRIVERRQKIVLAKATKSTALVSSLFPKNVRDRLMEDQKEVKETSILLGNKNRLKGFLDGKSNDEKNAKPIADLFPACTVFFADIAGFTAWSSTREPEQVFVLLQTVYQAFDTLAKRRKVFKVETIGDSYMAVTGLPEPQENHAVIMVRFAHDCLNKMNQLTKELEVELGPDTANLAMRFGLHSGQVTAGVLRGERARFQLFGDTVNTASRMESTGQRGKIQISQQTADCLVDAGKESWITQREDKVMAKGKGALTTFWASPTPRRASSVSSEETAPEPKSLIKDVDFKSVNHRLVDWMVDLLIDSIKKVVHARRQAGFKENPKAVVAYKPSGRNCLTEVKEVIEMPKFDAKKSAACDGDYTSVVIDPHVIDSLHSYVTVIASMYRDNPFHNFSHACHVTMSVSKLLKRIVAPELSNEALEGMKRADDLASHLHDYTHGITSDPIAVTAIVFSALIHDVDHRGVSNTQLIQEEPQMACRYDSKSVAEQNSVDVAWNVLMEDQYDELRRLMFGSQSDLLRFRQLLVNVVLATDIFDRELNALRKSRWEQAFYGEEAPTGNVDTNRRSDLRATIVIEHIIQASDVSHTMQHWHIYRKWNKCLFIEMYDAYRAGRMPKDPSTFWYAGELGFFDNYVIPLARKLKDCGVFGVSSDEYLQYAQNNRAEWKERGKEIVAELSKLMEAASPPIVSPTDPVISTDC